MSSPRRRLVATLLASIALSAGTILAIGLPAGAARDTGTSDSTEVKKGKTVATLHIIEDGVTVRKKGADEFKAGKEGQKLRVGDTVKTDATGFVQIDYTDDDESFTRLDVNTEFTIVSLSDEEGNRKVDGSVDVGRVWNRTTALTESESFSTEGAGATAAVEGTAYLVTCTAPNSCVFISVVDGVSLRTVDGEVQFLDPLQQCDATEVTDTDSNLCDVPQDIALEVLLADDWIAANIFLDALLGFLGPVSGVIVVEDGQLSFTQSSAPPAGALAPPGTPTPTPSVLDPTNPIGCFDGCDQAGSIFLGPTAVPDGFEPGSRIDADQFSYVNFVANLVVDPAGLFVVFDTLPSVGTIYVVCGGECYMLVETGEQYSANPDDGVLFVFEAGYETGTSDFSFHIENGSGGTVSDTATVPVEVHEGFGELSEPAASSPKPNGKPKSDPPPPEPEPTTTTSAPSPE